jgi:hypothetical protein
VSTKDTKLNIIIDAQNKSAAGFSALKKQLDVTQVSVAGVSSAMKTVGVVGTAALAGLTTFIAGSVQSYGEAQLAIAKVDATLKSMGHAADGTKERILEASAAVVRLGFDDEAAAVAITKLYQITGDLNQAMDLNALAMDLARNKNMGLEEAAKMVTMVLAGQGRALKEYGITLDDTKTPLEAIAQLQGMLAGQAEAATGSVNTQMLVLQETFSNLRDEIGQSLAPALTEFLVSITPVVEKITNWIDRNPELAKTILIAAAAVLAITAVMLPLGMALPGIVMAFTGLATIIAFIATGPGLIIVATIAAIGLAIVQLTRIALTLYNDWDMIWLGIQTLAKEATNSVIASVEGMINFIINGVNKAIEAINKVIKLAQKVPGFGDKVSTISTVKSVDFGRIDTGIISSNQMPGLQSSAPASTVVSITGNTFLDKDTAVKMGNLILDKLKFSSPI